MSSKSKKGLILQHFYRSEKTSEYTDYNVPYIYLFGKLINDKTFLVKTKYYPFFFIKKEDNNDLLNLVKNHNKNTINKIVLKLDKIEKHFEKLDHQMNENLSNKKQYELSLIKDLKGIFEDNEIYFINEHKIKNQNDKINKQITEANIEQLDSIKEIINIKSQLNHKDILKLISYALDSVEFCFEKTNLNNFDKNDMLKIVYFKPYADKKFFKVLENITRYESDINLSTKYLLEKNIKSQIEIISEPENVINKKFDKEKFLEHISKYKWSKEQKIDYYFENPEIINNEDDLSLSKHITTCAIDIETLQSNEIISISFYMKDKEIVIFNSNKPQIKKKHKFEVIQTNTEKDLLIKFNEILQQLDPDILTGWAFIDFDINMINKRMKHNRVEFNIGRVPMPPRVTINDNFLKESICMVPGRVVLDGIAILKDNFVKFDDYKLNTVAKEVLGESKIAAGGEVEELYQTNHDKLLEYNLIDSKLVYQIIVDGGYIEICIARSRITGMTLDKLDKSIQTLDYLYILKARTRNVLVPDNIGFNKERQIEGGYVRDPVTGIYDNILVFDFMSLYPSIMITLNIDKFSYIGNVEKLKDYKVFEKERFFDSKIKEDVITSPTGAVFKKEKAIIPDLLTNLWAERDIAKKEKNDVKSYAIKIAMNSMYGSIASPYSRFFSLDIAGSITAFARTIIKHTAEILQDDGYEVIYGDTDSIFVNAKIKSFEDNIKFGKKISDQINLKLNKLFKDKFGLNNRVELEFEKIYKKFYMPNVRGRETGAKKRYAGLKIDLKNKSEKVDVVGLEAVRRDWTTVAREFQLKMLDILFHNDNPESKMIKYAKTVVKDIREGKLDQNLLYRKGLKKNVEEYTKTTPPHVKAARLLDKIESNTIEYYITEDGPQPIQKLTSKIDYDHYIEKQIKPIAESIFVFFNLNFDDVLEGTKQNTLFGY